MSSTTSHEAKRLSSRLLARVVNGESVVITKEGKPVAKLVPLDTPSRPQPIGFLEGGFALADNFDQMGADEIAALFEGQS